MRNGWPSAFLEVLQERGRAVAGFALQSLFAVAVLCGGTLMAAIQVTVSPASVALTTGSSKTFTATVSGTSNTGVTWSVRELGGGTISSKYGSYVAPTTVGVYHIRATSKASTSVYGESTVTVVAPPDATISALPAVTAGQMNLAASVPNVAGSTYAWTISGGSLSSSATGNSVTFTAGTGAGLTLYCTVTNAAGITASSSKSQSVVAAPGISSFSASKTTVTIGHSLLLTPVFTNGTGSISPGIGSVSSGSAISVTPGSTTTYVLSVTNSLGVTTSSPLTVNVVAAPTITSFTSTKTTITAGTSTNLAAVFSNGTATISGLGTVVSGSPVSTGALNLGTTFTLTVTNTAGETLTANVTVNVVSAPTISSFSTAKTTITTGSTTTLSAVFSGGVGTIDHGVGSVLSGGSVSTGNLTANTSYTLTVSNAAGDSVTQIVTVNVAAAPAITAFTATKSPLTTGKATSLMAVFSGGSGSIDNGIGSVTSNILAPTAPLSAATTYTLTVTNAAGDSVTQQVTVSVVAAPSITTFTAAKSPLTTGTATTLLAAFSGGTGSVDNGIGSVTSNVSAPTAPLSTATTYTLTVTNAAGDSVTQQATVSVVAAPSITTFTAAKSPLTTGTATTLLAAFSGGTGSVDNGIGSVSSNVSVPTAPLRAPTTYTLTVTNAAGDSVTQQLSVNVVAVPSITAFTAAKSPLTAGKATSLMAAFSGGTGVVDNGVGSVVSNVAIPTGPLSANKTYTLTVTNEAGDSITQQVLVNVVAAPVISGFAAAKSPITTGEATSLLATFTDGTAGIDNGIGPVSSGMSVTTPLLTVDTTYTLTVTNEAGDQAIQTLTVATVAAPNISNFTANPAGILVGGTSSLSWSATGTSSASIDGGIGDVMGRPSVQVSPGSTTTYTLTVSNQAGTKAMAQVSVHTLATPTVSLDRYVTEGKPSLVASTPDQGPDVTYVWTLTNGTIQTGQGTRNITYSAGTPGALTASVKASIQSLEAVDTANATVVPAPMADIFAQGQVFYGAQGIQASTPAQDGMTYLWNLTSGTGSAAFSGATDASVVTYGTGSSVGTYQLTVNVQNLAGDFASSTRTLNVVSNQFLKDVHTSVQREGHTATTLANGRILVAGGNGTGAYSAELYDPATDTWTKAGDMVAVRQFHSATLLKNGKVLVAGGVGTATAELYDPATDRWSAVNSMATARKYHAAVLLNSGKVLVIEGTSSTGGSLSSAELFDPVTGTWSGAALLSGARGRPKAVLLGNGNVMVAGGGNLAELYDPTTNAWSRTPTMLAPYRTDPTMTVLADGRVLVAGGGDTPKPAVNAEVYDPLSNTWSATGNMVSYTPWRVATRLKDGRVLVTGGLVSTNQMSASSEVYDPSTNNWSVVGSLALARIQHTASLLGNGRVLVTGGGTGGASVSFANAETFDPTTATWSSAGSMVGHGSGNTATLLPDGKVLVVGGGSDYRVEKYDPSANTWSSAGALTVIRTGFTSTLLPGGTLLVAGGNLVKPGNELYTPSTNAWGAAGNLLTARDNHTATLLGNGKVLVSGGQSYSNGYTWPLASAEIYDPSTNAFSSVAGMATARHRHVAVALGNGKVLAIGGYGFGALSSAELYNPASNTWATGGNMSIPREYPSATMLQNGKVLVVGGGATSADLYDPSTNAWSSGGNMAVSRFNGITMTLLPDGTVLVASNGTAEVYDPSTNSWSSSGPMTSSRSGHSAVLLGTGNVMITGGWPAYIPEYWKK